MRMSYSRQHTQRVRIRTSILDAKISIGILYKAAYPKSEDQNKHIRY